MSRASLATTLAICFGCHAGAAASASPSADGDLASRSPVLPRGRLVIHSKAGPQAFAVEIARDPASHERGLMFRREVPDGTGMLFVFPDETPRVFWMKNTLVALDMIFISSAGKIVGIVENAEPLTTTARESGAPARYVLEIAGGAAFARGLSLGSLVDLEIPDR